VPLLRSAIIGSSGRSSNGFPEEKVLALKKSKPAAVRRRQSTGHSVPDLGVSAADNQDPAFDRAGEKSLGWVPTYDFASGSAQTEPGWSSPFC